MSQTLSEVTFRKSARLPGYDYRAANYYFLTICTQNKRCIFYSDGKINEYGKITQECISQISVRFSGYRVDKCVVMPNHVHMILAVEGSSELSVSSVIGLLKSAVSKRIRILDSGVVVWQRSFHDHIIRNQADYERIWSYIDTNPARWHEDCFYSEPIL